jgi:hypothetical protein
LLKDKLARRLGVQKHRLDTLCLMAGLLSKIMSLHILEYLAPLLLESPPSLASQKGISRVEGGPAQNNRASSSALTSHSVVSTESSHEVSAQPIFTCWSTLDLGEGKAFYNARVCLLTYILAKAFPTWMKSSKIMAS